MWRIATDTPAYGADDLSGADAKVTGGRWNSAGVPLLYCSGSIALACLETIIHLKAGGLPFNRYLVRLDIPDAVWATATDLTSGAAPVGWDAIPAGLASIGAGDRWVAACASALLLVPSVVVPDEWNVLLNPLHPDAGGVTARKVRRWHYDPRMG